MGHLLKVHIVEAKHYLVDDVGSLTLCKARDLGETLEEFATSDELGDHVVVLMVLH